MKRTHLLLLSTILLASLALMGAGPPETLLSLAHRVEAIEDLRARDVLDEQEATRELETLMASAHRIGGEDVDREALAAISREAATPGPLERVAGALTFLNLVTFLASAILVSSLLRLVAMYLWPWIRNLPPWVHELAFHAASAGVTFGGLRVDPLYAEWIGRVGCLLWGAAMTFSFAREGRREAGWTTPSLAFALLTGIYATAAVTYGSEVIADMSVGSFVAMLGFSSVVMPAVVFLGYESKDPIPRAMVCSFLVLAAGVGSKLSLILDPTWSLFAGAAVQDGAFVYLVSLLVISSRWYGHSSRALYLARQVLAVASCLLGAWLGAVYGIGVLQRFCGTTLTLYVMAKYWEFPWRKGLYVWVLFLFSFVLYGVALLARRYPEYFVF